eukprot:17714-Heterococcus_DN1.PRE.2
MYKKKFRNIAAVVLYAVCTLKLSNFYLIQLLQEAGFCRFVCAAMKRSAVVLQLQRPSELAALRHRQSCHIVLPIIVGSSGLTLSLQQSTLTSGKQLLALE